MGMSAMQLFLCQSLLPTTPSQLDRLGHDLCSKSSAFLSSRKSDLTAEAPWTNESDFLAFQPRFLSPDMIPPLSLAHR
jgi:hypothetical protein